jgi:hypothetical protein
MNDDQVIKDAIANPKFREMAAQSFGPAMWTSIHDIALAYDPTPEKKQALVAFMENLATLFPCQKCSPHIREAIKTMPTDSKLSVFKWSIDFHNSVNARTGKPILSYQQAIDAIAKNSASRKHQKPCKAWNINCCILATFLILAVIAIIVMSVYIWNSPKSSSEVTGALNEA